MEKIIEKKFRIQTKEFFLTYPQSGGLTLEYVRENLYNILKTFVLKEYLISKELHSDGQPHLHVYCKTLKRSSIENPNYFDIEFEGEVFHPNVQASKKAGNVIRYILKFVTSKYDENLLFSKGLEFRIDENAEFMPLAESAIKMASQGKIKEAMLLYEKEKPDFYLTSHLSLEKSLRGIFLKAQGASAKFNFNAFNLPAGLVEKLKFADEKLKSVILIGDAGTGKSRFIQSYVIDLLGLHPLIINDFNSIKSFNCNVHNAIIIDDASLKNLEREVLIKLLDSEEKSTFRVTHGSIEIPERTPRFLISNKELKELLSFELDEAITRRIEVIAIKDLKLFQL